MLKQIFIDTETTGLSPTRNTVWQIAGSIYVGKLTKHFDLRCCPIASKNIDEKALEVGGVELATLHTYAKAKEIHRQLTDLLSMYVDKFNARDKFTMYGYNVQFDSEMLRQWFKDLGDSFFGSWFFYPPVDVMALAAEALCNERHKMKDFKLGTVAKHLGITVDDATLHDASVDVALTYAIYQQLKTKGASMPNTEV